MLLHINRVPYLTAYCQRFGYASNYWVVYLPIGPKALLRWYLSAN